MRAKFQTMSVQHPTVHLNAECACGAASIAVEGRIGTMFLCACLECQKVSGAGHTAAAIADARNVTVSGGLHSYARPADSGATLTRHFCPVCATTLVAETSRRPDIRLIPAGLFTDQSWFSPGQVLFSRSHRQWDALPDDIPRHQTYRED